MPLGLGRGRCLPACLSPAFLPHCLVAFLPPASLFAPFSLLSRRLCGEMNSLSLHFILELERFSPLNARTYSPITCTFFLEIPLAAVASVAYAKSGKMSTRIKTRSWLAPRAGDHRKHALAPLGQLRIPLPTPMSTMCCAGYSIVRPSLQDPRSRKRSFLRMSLCLRDVPAEGWPRAHSHHHSQIGRNISCNCLHFLIATCRIRIRSNSFRFNKSSVSNRNKTGGLPFAFSRHRFAWSQPPQFSTLTAQLLPWAPTGKCFCGNCSLQSAQTLNHDSPLTTHLSRFLGVSLSSGRIWLGGLDSNQMPAASGLENNDQIQTL